jgi:hypothetical protein
MSYGEIVHESGRNVNRKLQSGDTHTTQGQGDEPQEMKAGPAAIPPVDPVDNEEDFREKGSSIRDGLDRGRTCGRKCYVSIIGDESKGTL